MDELKLGRQIKEPVTANSMTDRKKPSLSAEFLFAVKKFDDFIQASLKSSPQDVLLQFRAETGGYKDRAALKAGFMFTLLSKEQRHKGYVESNDVMELRQLAGGHLTNSTMQDLRLDDGDEPPKRSDALKSAARELVRCELAVREALNNFALASETPFEPIFQIINNELPLIEGSAVDRERVYGPIARAIAKAQIDFANNEFA